ncbi:hypothetical protein PI125_g9224 [Phytophthora idaei]|nr:hypothetical protein PI125_g9224 [Phytophthora idaei]
MSGMSGGRVGLFRGVPADEVDGEAACCTAALRDGGTLVSIGTECVTEELAVEVSPGSDWLGVSAGVGCATGGTVS